MEIMGKNCEKWKFGGKTIVKIWGKNIVKIWGLRMVGQVGI